MNKLAERLAFSTVTLLAGMAGAEEPEVDEVPPAVGPVTIAEPAPRPFPDREGFTIGFAAGPGWLSSDGKDIDAGTTRGLSLRLGTAITPEFMIQLNLEAVRTQNEDSDVGGQLSLIGGSLVGYLHPRIYLLAGLGVARATIDHRSGIVAASERAPGVLFGAGVEVWQTSHFALSLEARFIGAAFEAETDTGTSVQLGFQWW